MKHGEQASPPHLSFTSLLACIIHSLPRPDQLAFVHENAARTDRTQEEELCSGVCLVD